MTWVLQPLWDGPGAEKSGLCRPLVSAMMLGETVCKISYLLFSIIEKKCKLGFSMQNICMFAFISNMIVIKSHFNLSTYF